MPLLFAHYLKKKKRFIAEYLAKTFESMYGKVLFCGVDVDPDLKYPKVSSFVSLWVDLDSE